MITEVFHVNIGFLHLWSSLQNGKIKESEAFTNTLGVLQQNEQTTFFLRAKYRSDPMSDFNIRISADTFGFL